MTRVDRMAVEFGVTPARIRQLVSAALLRFAKHWNCMYPKDPLPLSTRRPCDCGKTPGKRGRHRSGCAYTVKW